MRETRPHLEALEKLERECLPGLVEVLREEGLEAVRYFLWDLTGWHHTYDPVLWRNRATEEQKRIGWEMWVRMDKIMCAVLREAHESQAAGTILRLCKPFRRLARGVCYRAPSSTSSIPSFITLSSQAPTLTASASSHSYHDLIAHREAVEEDLEWARVEAGLDQYEVRRWEAWHRHVTLCLLAHAALEGTCGYKYSRNAFLPRSRTAATWQQ